MHFLLATDFSQRLRFTFLYDLVCFTDLVDSCVFIFVLLGKKTSVDKPLLEYMSKTLNTR